MSRHISLIWQPVAIIGRDKMEKITLTAAEVQARYRISARTLHRRIKDGSFPKPLFSGGQLRVWLISGLEAWERGNTNEA
jgi:predicted DNA-binding transcriptional regulator AlpA